MKTSTVLILSVEEARDLLSHVFTKKLATNRDETAQQIRNGEIRNLPVVDELSAKLIAESLRKSKIDDQIRSSGSDATAVGAVSRQSLGADMILIEDGEELISFWKKGDSVECHARVIGTNPFDRKQVLFLENCGGKFNVYKVFENQKEYFWYTVNSAGWCSARPFGFATEVEVLKWLNNYFDDNWYWSGQHEIADNVVVYKIGSNTRSFFIARRAMQECSRTGWLYLHKDRQWHDVGPVEPLANTFYEAEQFYLSSLSPANNETSVVEKAPANNETSVVEKAPEEQFIGVNPLNRAEEIFLVKESRGFVVCKRSKGYAETYLTGSDLSWTCRKEWYAESATAFGYLNQYLDKNWRQSEIEFHPKTGKQVVIFRHDTGPIGARGYAIARRATKQEGNGSGTAWMYLHDDLTWKSNMITKTFETPFEAEAHYRLSLREVKDEVVGTHPYYFTDIHCCENERGWQIYYTHNGEKIYLVNEGSSTSLKWVANESTDIWSRQVAMEMLAKYLDSTALKNGEKRELTLGTDPHDGGNVFLRSTKEGFSVVWQASGAGAWSYKFFLKEGRWLRAEYYYDKPAKAYRAFLHYVKVSFDKPECLASLPELLKAAEAL